MLATWSQHASREKRRRFSMYLGFRLPHFGPAAAPAVIRTAAEIAEADGWHSVWASDRVAVPAHRPGELNFLDDYVQTFETFVTLAFVASATRHIRLGTSALVVPQRQIMLLARQAASLDVLSEGRLTLAVAAGWAESEFEAAGAGDRFAVRGQILDEAIGALRVLWTETPAEFSGRQLSFPQVDFAPQPVQAGGIPLVVAGNSAAARRRAARLGDGWNPTELGAAETAAGMAEINSLRQEYGRQGAFVSIGSRRFNDDMRATRAALETYAEQGLDVMICRLTDPDPGGVLERLRRFGREVLPAFGAAVA
jgi:probable F420-dependent oxidoreductase